MRKFKQGLSWGIALCLVLSVFTVLSFTANAAGSTPPGELTGSIAKSSFRSVNLTSLGDVDWAVWGYANSGKSTSLAPDASMSGGTAISNLTDIDPGTNDALRGLGQFRINHTFSWTNGSGTASAANVYGGIQHEIKATYETGDGFSFTVPADTTKRRLIVYTAVHFAVGELTATLSDGSATRLTLQQDSKTSVNSPSRFVIDYAAASDGQTLTIKFVVTWNSNDGNGNVQIYTAALSNYHTATINVFKDGTAADASGSLELRQSGSTVATAASGSETGVYTALVLNGAYDVYIGGADTGTDITINAADSSANVNYYTVSYAISDAGKASGSTISATAGGSTVTSGTAVFSGKTVVITASGAGADSYAYAWTGTGTDSANGKNTESMTIAALNGKVDTTCTVTGTLTGTIRISGDPSKTYDGNAVEAPAVTKNGTGAVTYCYYNDNSGVIGTALLGAPSAAGTYWVKAEMAQDMDYTSAEDTKKFTISRAAGSITITGDPSKTYDGSAVSDPAVSKTGSGNVTYTYYADNGGSMGTLLSGAPVSAGTYWVKATVAQCDTYTQATATKQFIISKNSIDTDTEAKLLLLYSLDSVTYNGSSQSVSVTVVSGITGLGVITVYYEGTGSTVYAKSTTAPTNAGDYTVSVNIAEGSNYGSYASLGLGSYTINKTTITGVTDDDYSGTYDGDGHSIALSGVPSGAEVACRVNSSGEYDLTSLPVLTDAGTYTIDYIIRKANYYDLIGTAQVIISQKALTSAMVGDISGTFTYNGFAQTPVFTVTDGTPSITALSDYTVSYENNTDAGTATVAVIASAVGNYTGTVIKTFVIDQKELTTEMITPVAALTYNGTEQTPALTVTDGTPSIITAADYMVSYANNMDAGIATASITASEDGNYAGMVSVPFIIKQKALDPFMISDIAPVTYNGFAQTPVFTVTDGTPSNIESSDYTYIYTNNTNAGAALLTITATMNGNYTGTAVKTFTINKKVLTSSMIGDIDDMVYTGAALTPDVVVSNGTPSIIKASDYSLIFSNNTNAGTATVTVTAAKTGNYTGSVAKQFDIAPSAIEGAVRILNSAMNGDVIEADISSILPTQAWTELAYQWRRNGVLITGATAASYTATAEDVGKTLTVTVTGTGNFLGSLTSLGVAVNAKVSSSPITLVAPVFGGNAVTIGGNVVITGGTYTASISIKTPTDSTWEILENGTYSSGNTFSVGLSDLTPGTVYIYRITVVMDGQTYTMTGRFLTPTENNSGTVHTGSITGSVQDNTGMQAEISVTIEEGNTVIASRTGLNNSSTFNFAGLPDGIYNVVANNGSYRVTKIIAVENGEAVGGIQMTIEKKQSVVTISTDDTPDIAVGGLNELFQYESMFTTADALIVANGGTVEIRLIAEKLEEAGIDTADMDKLSEIAGSSQIAMYLDLSVIKTVYDNSGNENEQTSLSEIANLIEVVIPIPKDLQGKGALAIYRMHNDIAEIIPEGIENANGDGEYCVIEDGYITLYVKNFCTYAIGYTKEVQTQSCVIHWWLLAILLALIITGTVITRCNSKRIRDLKGGIEI